MPHIESLCLSSRRVGYAIFVLLIAGVCLSQMKERPSVPAGWAEFRPPKDGSQALQCANYSTQQWRVSLENGSLVMGEAPKANPKAVLPAHIRLKRGMSGQRSTLKIQNGWLLGFDGGEFGGGLWWSNEDGSQTSRILNENVKGILATSKGVLVLVGLAHIDLDVGKVFIIPDSAKPKEIRRLVSLDGAPQAFAIESPTTVLVTTTHGVSRVSFSGNLEVLAHAPFSLLYPNSMVVTADKAIYVGMRLLVVRFLPEAPGYRAQWLVRSECQHFEIRGQGCSCTPTPNRANR
jgi:hypothetical protein